ncbi:hypothetical protein [Streptomyces uncialis]
MELHRPGPDRGRSRDAPGPRSLVDARPLTAGGQVLLVRVP